MKNLFSIFFISVLNFAYSQHLERTSITFDKSTTIDYPESSSFTDYSKGKYVDLYTGKTNINIPINTIKSKDITIPLALSYNNDGIKVDQIASRVGLGWQAPAEFYIRREVQGEPDEATYDDLFYNSETEVTLGRWMDLYKKEDFASFDINKDFAIDDYADFIRDFDQDLLLNRSCLELQTLTLKESWTYNDDRIYYKNYTYLELLQSLVWGRPHCGGGSDIRTFFHPIYRGKYRDTKPDIFYFNLPNNIRGSFVLDKHGDVVLLSGNPNVKIQPAIGPKAINKWVITSDEGHSFEFYDNEDYFEESAYQFMEVDIDDYKFQYQDYIPTDNRSDVIRTNYDKIPLRVRTEGIGGTTTPTDDDGEYVRYRIKHKSLWHLTKIKSFITDEEVNFKYEPYDDIENFKIFETKFHFIENQVTCLTDPRAPNDLASGFNIVSTDKNPHDDLIFVPGTSRGWGDGSKGFDKSLYNPRLTKIINPKRLSEITFSSGKVTFKNSSTQRLDLNGNYALDQIKISNNFGEVVNTYEFDYSYFSGEQKRLRLIAFFESDNLNTNDKKYEFEYFDDFNLPAYDSYKKDLWGYYTVNNTKETLIPEINVFDRVFEGADRSPNISARANSLKKVNFPTGGYLEYEYGLNEISYTHDNKSYNSKIGGLRVEKTTLNDGNDEIISEYEYSLGSTPHFKQHDWSHNFFSEAKFIYIQENTRADCNNVNLDIKTSSSTLYDIKRTRGGLVGYGSVTISHQDNSKEIYKYTNPIDYPDLKSECLLFPFRKEFNSDYHDNNETSRDQLRGLLKSKEYYTSDNILVKSEVNEYDENPTRNNLKINTTDIYKTYNRGHFQFKVDLLYASEATWFTLYAYVADFSELRSYFPFVSTTTTTEFDLSGDLLTVNNEFFKKDSPYHSSTTYNEVELDSDNSLIYEYKYTLDDLSDSESNLSAIQLMKNNNVLKLQSESSFKATNTSSGSSSNITFNPITETQYLFDLFNDKPNLSKIKKKKEDGSFYDLNNITKYNELGNILEIELPNGAYESYVWGYGNEYLIAKIQNIKYDEISTYINNLQSLSNTDDDNCLDIENCNESSLRSALNSLRELPALSDTMITTYTYDPLVGVTSITDPKGYTTYYQYDDLQRLQCVKDANGNILSKNNYHYKD